VPGLEPTRIEVIPGYLVGHQFRCSVSRYRTIGRPVGLAASDHPEPASYLVGQAALLSYPASHYRGRSPMIRPRVTIDERAHLTQLCLTELTEFRMWSFRTMNVT
jgi:hypothetical protein